MMKIVEDGAETPESVTRCGEQIGVSALPPTRIARDPTHQLRIGQNFRDSIQIEVSWRQSHLLLRSKGSEYVLK